MSSFISHALVGSSCLLFAFPRAHCRALPCVVIGAGLGLSSDIDYLMLWLVGWETEPRITHSLGFVVICCLFAWIPARYTLPELSGPRLLLVLFVAAASHLIMDACVGVTKNPMLWPLSNEGYRFAIGFLPSAGKLDVNNYYFWRNLLIELGIVCPIVCIVHAVIIKHRIGVASVNFFIMLSVLFAALAAGLGLAR